MPRYAIFAQRGTRWKPVAATRESGECQMRLVASGSHRMALEQLVDRAGGGTYRVFDWDSGEARTFQVSIPERPSAVIEEL